MPPLPPTLVFAQAGFWMLGWLSAAAAPLLIHLWSRQKYRQMSWAAMEYLLAAVRRSRRRTRIEQWILLAIRTLIILLVVLAVLESLWEHGGLTPSATGRTHRVLVVDGSYSMAYKPKDETRFDRARQLARQIVQQSRQGDAFTLILMSSPPRVVIGKPALQPSDVLEEIDNLRIAHTTADLPATVEKIHQVLRQAGREDPGLARHEVYFLTDLGRVGWMPKLSAAAAAGFRKRSKELAESAALVVIDLGQADAENVALTGLQSLQPMVTVARDVVLQATLKNFGRQPITGQSVELWVDGRHLERQQVDLVPGKEASVAFSCRFETPGDHLVEIRAGGDLLDVDNHRWMAIPVRQSIRVLCINGRPSGEPFGRATDFLLYALSPQAGREERPLIHPEVVAESELLERDLGDYDCVFLCEVAQFTASEARVLDSYLNGGGNLVFFLGERVLADRYNRELGGRAGGVRVLPALLVPGETEPQESLDPLGYRHPIVRAFQGRQRAGLLTTPVLKYFKLEIPPDSNANVVLAMANGDPLIVEETIRRGRVVLVATSADVSWTAMPLGPSYVPVVQEMLAWCVGGQLQGRNVAVGQPLDISLSGPATDVPLRVQGPGGSSREVRLQGDGSFSTFSYGDTTTSGIYAARFGPPVSRTQNFAVNVDTVESDLRQVSQEELRKRVWPGVAFDHHIEWRNLQRPVTAAIARPSPLDLEMLYVVLGLLFLETLLAWRFGHQTT